MEAISFILSIETTPTTQEDQKVTFNVTNESDMLKMK